MFFITKHASDRWTGRILTAIASYSNNWTVAKNVMLMNEERRADKEYNGELMASVNNIHIYMVYVYRKTIKSNRIDYMYFGSVTIA